MKRSAGLLMMRRSASGAIEVLLAHPGGPYWRNKDAGAWSIPKGELDPGEDALGAAKREWEEETGHAANGPFAPLGEVTQKSGKHIVAWAFAGQFDPAHLRSNSFEMEWPPRSGRMQAFPEIDRVQWFGLDEARVKINAGQVPLLDRLAQLR
jgi:predicted NUDIX family NTP pyrophosphohydrolase